jgi:hypothetical protein
MGINAHFSHLQYGHTYWAIWPIHLSTDQAIVPLDGRAKDLSPTEIRGGKLMMARIEPGCSPDSGRGVSAKRMALVVLALAAALSVALLVIGGVGLQAAEAQTARLIQEEAHA